MWDTFINMFLKEVKFEWSNKYNVFASEQFLSCTSKDYHWIGGFVNGNLSYVMPYTVKSKLGFKYIIFHSTAINIIDNSGYSTQIFYDDVVQYFKKSGFDFIAQSPTYVQFEYAPAGSIFAPFGSYVINLKLEEEVLWNNLHSKHRNVIRNAQKNNVIIKRDKQFINIAYNLLLETMLRSGMDFITKGCFNKYIEKLGENVDIFIAFHEEKPQGCAVIPYSNEGAYYLWGGGIKNPFLGSLNLLQWEAIKYYKSKFVLKYDFVGARIIPAKGSKIEGIQRFKERFGSTLIAGYLWKYIYKPKKYLIYRFLTRIQKRKIFTYNGDIIDQENQSQKKRDNFNL
jgi:hypothetical protein